MFPYLVALLVLTWFIVKHGAMKGGHSLRCTSLRRRVLYIAVATVVSLISAAAGQDEDPNHGVVFIYPTKDQIYNTMDTVNVTYTSPFPTPNLYTFCDGGSRQGEPNPLRPFGSRALSETLTLCR